MAQRSSAFVSVSSIPASVPESGNLVCVKYIIYFHKKLVNFYIAKNPAVCLNGFSPIGFIALIGKIAEYTRAREGPPPAESRPAEKLLGSSVSAGQSPAGSPVTARKRGALISCRMAGGTAEGQPFVPMGMKGLFVYDTHFDRSRQNKCFRTA
jgi:hypothetical protein